MTKYQKIKIKALSVNDAWQGRRFKSKDYKEYEKSLFYLLPKLKVPKDKKLFLEIKVGFSNKRSDLDNIAKTFIDVLQKKYSFDDKWIYKILLNKNIVKKGQEFISFKINVLCK